MNSNRAAGEELDHYMERTRTLSEELARFKRALENQMAVASELKRYLHNAKKKLANLQTCYDELQENHLTMCNELVRCKRLLREIGNYIVKPSSCDCPECNDAYYKLVNEVRQVIMRGEEHE